MSSQGEEKKPLEALFKLGNKEKKPIKSLYYKLGIILIAGLLLMSFGNWGMPDSKKEGQIAAVEIPSGNQHAFEEKLEAILGSIKGAGEVNVALTFFSNGSREYAFNEQKSESVIKEQDAGETAKRDSHSVTSSLDLVMQNDGPVIVQEYPPQIQGVLIVAEGAGDPQIKRELFQAVQGLLGIPAHRIIIAQGK